MRRRATVALAAVVVASASACSSSKPPLSGDVDAAPNDAASTLVRDGGARDAGSDAPLGDLPVVDEEDVPCVPSSGVSVTIYPAAGAPVLAKLRKAGGRFAAGGLDLAGLVTFDAVGTNAQAAASTLGADTADFDSDGTNLHMAGVTPTAVLYGRFDAQGNAVGDPIQLARALTSVPTSPSIASGAQGTLVVWGASGTVRAIGIKPDGSVAGSAFDVAAGAWRTALFTSVAYDGTNFVVAWTGDPSGTGTSPTTRASLATVSLTGVVGAPIDVTSAANVFRIIKLAVVPGGYVALYNGIGEDEVFVVGLDTSGKPRGAAHRLFGADFPADLVVQGSEAGLLVQRRIENPGAAEPYEPMFRRLDLTGKPLDPWVCLTKGPMPDGAPLPAGLLVDGAGYAAVFRGTSNEDVLMRFDHLGTGAP